MNSDKNSLLDVLQTLKLNIFRTLKVATLGIVKQVNTDKKELVVEAFPKESDVTPSLITCRYLNEGATIGEIVVVLFLDLNFLANLSRIENGITEIMTVSSDVKADNLHSEKFGIAIKTL